MMIMIKHLQMNEISEFDVQLNNKRNQTILLCHLLCNARLVEDKKSMPQRTKEVLPLRHSVDKENEIAVLPFFIML